MWDKVPSPYTGLRAAQLNCWAALMSTANSVSIADVMQVYAKEAEGLVRSQTGEFLDYSEASLRHVDLLIAGQLKDGIISPDSLSSQEEAELWMFCKRVGGYLGEVIIRNLGGVAYQATAGGRPVRPPFDSGWHRGATTKFGMALPHRA